MTGERIAAGARWVLVAAALVLVCCVGALVVGDPFGDRDGDDVAADIADEEAAGLHTALDRGTVRGTAEDIAATRIVPEHALDPPPGQPATTITPIAWAGETTPQEPAIIDVRIDVTVEEHQPGAFGDRYHSAGHATRCYRYEIDYYRADHHRIDCPKTTAPPPKPTPSPVARLPRDAAARLTEVLAGAAPDTLATAVRAAFPDPGLTVDTATHDGTLVVAVGAPRERRCVLMIRTPAGKISSPGYDPVQLTPGELGCGTDLYLRPPG
jgi:hypothetical protein